MAEAPSAGVRRSAGDLLTAAEEHWARRQRRVEEGEAAERRRRVEAAAAAREQRLDALARNPKKAWTQVDALIETRRGKEYDAAVILLKDLQALAGRGGDASGFAQQMRQLRERHARKPSLLDRLDRVQLD